MTAQLYCFGESGNSYKVAPCSDLDGLGLDAHLC